MTPKYPEICPQQLIEPWWEQCSDKIIKQGRLVWAFLPHVDQSPFTLEPVGRDEPTEHKTAQIRIKAFQIGNPPLAKNLPVAAMPLYDKEIFCVYRTKKRPAIVISKGGTLVEKALTRDLPKWRTNRTVLLAPSYSVDKGYGDEFCDRVRRCEYPQFLWDNLPIGGTEKGSIIRLDHLQPIGKGEKSIELTDYCLSEKALAFVLEWFDWLVTGNLKQKSIFCDTRSFLLAF